MKTVRVKVTWWDIWRGSPNDGSCCPVARAVSRALRTDSVWVWESGNIDLGSRQTITPREVRAFVESYDNGHKVKPFAFDLEVQP